MKVKGISLGCKVNTYEMEYILSSFKEHGYEITNVVFISKYDTTLPDVIVEIECYER